MEIIKPGTHIDFVGKRKIAYSISGALILLSIISLIVHGGPKFGIDFVGGSLIQVKFSQQTPIDKIKDGLRAVNIENATVQNMGAATDNEFLIRIDAADINAQDGESAVDHFGQHFYPLINILTVANKLNFEIGHVIAPLSRCT